LNMKLKEREVIKRVKSSLKKVGMEGYEDRSSHHLSEGEKKKISLAGVLAMDPPVIAFDEPTANLDPRSRKNIIHVIKSCSHTKLIVSHDLEMIFTLCSRIILLKDGQIKFDGKAPFLKKHKEILRQNELI
ncbi:MAG: energy-coupling factor ABC transporter ATP-binding protein, partial [Spirochaetes bacterium]|nr:energy-coupling factor ABC transporter ATP-binding protein [Spirochaetota bacterium]